MMWQPHDGKIFSLIWMEIDDHLLLTGYNTKELLLSSGPNGEMVSVEYCSNLNC